MPCWPQRRPGHIGATTGNVRLAGGHAGEPLVAFHRGRDFLAVVLVERGLVVEQVDVREAFGWKRQRTRLALGVKCGRAVRALAEPVAPEASASRRDGPACVLRAVAPMRAGGGAEERAASGVSLEVVEWVHGSYQPIASVVDAGQWPGYHRLVARDGFAQVQQQRGDLRPGGVFGDGDVFVARRFAVGEIFVGGGFVVGVARAFAAERVGEHGELVVRRRARDAFFECPAEAVGVVVGCARRSARRTPATASTNCTSLSSTSACSGVVVVGRATVQISRLGASNATMFGGGTVRFQYV